MKFSVDDQVGEVKGNQLVARKYYVDIIKIEANAAMKSQRLEVNTIWRHLQLWSMKREKKYKFSLTNQRLLLK